MKFQLTDMVVTKETPVDKYAFIPITKEQYLVFDNFNSQYHNGLITSDAFIEKFGYSPLAFVLHGETAGADSEMIRPYIDCVDVKESEIHTHRKSYKCFCGAKFGLDYTKQVLHGTAFDAWNCLLTFCNNPKYGIVLNLRYI